MHASAISAPATARTGTLCAVSVDLCCKWHSSTSQRRGNSQPRSGGAMVKASKQRSSHEWMREFCFAFFVLRRASPTNTLANMVVRNFCVLLAGLTYSPPAVSNSARNPYVRTHSPRSPLRRRSTCGVKTRDAICRFFFWRIRAIS